MRAITYSAFRNNLKENIRQIRDDAEPLLVTNKDAEDNIVVINQSEYDSLMETVRIYQNPVMYERIRRNMQEVIDGNVIQHSLVEDE